ncbi:hypothetical protein [Runella slithyformis]|uniref:Bacteriocin n=1 Tax=Runella slithyformis (strain ATCC 29530 / DSM 19594 / LMG 11500 / NCIMB 11436 / LSU 4) TaxID=761193 RepID=A0A7U3ZKF0_RUNSL|nr:hypothetical protein [Runella slithyformis]AEI48857.1 hypothetical protein Runsl_2452 [Runella slithyformis DSM 19594]
MQTQKKHKPQLIFDFRHEGVNELNMEEALEISGGNILDDIWKATLGSLITISYNFGKAVGGWLERLLD